MSCRKYFLILLKFTQGAFSHFRLQIVFHPAHSNSLHIICHKFNLQACGVQRQTYDCGIDSVCSSTLMSSISFLPLTSFPPPPQILKLSYNKLREISSSLTFSGLTSLLRLYLDHNLLQHIHPRAFLQLPSLRLLRLQGNRLHQLHPHALCTLSLLNTYYFSTLR